MILQKIQRRATVLENTNTNPRVSEQKRTNHEC